MANRSHAFNKALVHETNAACVPRGARLRVQANTWHPRDTAHHCLRDTGKAVLADARVPPLLSLNLKGNSENDILSFGVSRRLIRDK